MGIRILVIEDEPEIADFVVRGLREEGFTVERAADGDEAWHGLQTRTWDVVLLDWWLPGADGLTLLRRFRQGGATTPVGDTSGTQTTEQSAMPGVIDVHSGSTEKALDGTVYKDW